MTIALINSEKKEIIDFDKKFDNVSKLGDNLIYKIDGWNKIHWCFEHGTQVDLAIGNVASLGFRKLWCCKSICCYKL